MRIAYFVTHPIQYQAPLLRLLSSQPEIDLKVFYLSDFSLHQHYEAAFNQSFQWDVSLNEGYQWELMPRFGIGKSTPLRPWWPISGLRDCLKKGKFEAVWVHGWGHLGLRQAINAAHSLAIPVLLRGESAPDWSSAVTMKQRLRDFYCQRLFAKINSFLFIGSRNRKFYEHFGVTDDRLIAMPYAVDNEYFQACCAAAAPSRETLRERLGLIPGRPIILFAAKFIPVKAPLELLKAFATLLPTSSVKPYLLFVGDGPLRPALTSQAAPLGDAVRFLGFRNQSELPALYDLCDVFVLPSQFEPWGLVINEVMNAAKPVIVSDRVGAGDDLVQNEKNGFVYPSGDIKGLANHLGSLTHDASIRNEMGVASLKRINQWSFHEDHLGLASALRQYTK